MTVTLKDIEAAAEVIRGQVIETPFLHSRTLSEITGAEVHLKFENHQFTASFKERGAFNKLSSLTPEERKRGVIACSAGNHAQGVAYHAKRLVIPATIVMPRYTPFVKVEQTRGTGAGISRAQLRRREDFAPEGGGRARLTLVHLTTPRRSSGQGTCGLEMMRARPDLDALIVAIGGGGLIAGISTAAKSIKPSIDVYGVEVKRFPAMYHAMKGTTPEFAASTIAEGIAVKEPGTLTLPIIRKNVKEVILVDEGDIE
jgi:threonine dehydratase